MERLTERTADGILVKENYEKESLKTLYSCYGEKPNSYYSNCEEGYCAMEKLADYEDAEEQGRLIKLPCKVGNTVYRYVEEKGCVLEYTVWNISMSAYESGGIDIVIEGCAESEDEVEDEFSLSLIDFKNEFFNTKSEAEQKLREMTDNFDLE